MPVEAHECGPTGPADPGTVAMMSGLADAADQPQPEGGGVQRRIVGLDLGVATDHTAVILDQTGPAWLPVAVFFASTGDVVYRVSSQKAADLRRYYRRHHKTNRIDATTLARIAILEGEALRPVELA